MLIAPLSDNEYREIEKEMYRTGELEPWGRGHYPIPHVSTTRRHHAQAPRCSRGVHRRAREKTGDDGDEGEPPRPLLDQAALADLLCISKKTLQNQYSVAPHTLPPAIAVPGARGPRWTRQSVQEWLESRPRHTPKIAPVAPRRKVGRPRIALVKQGGAA